MPAVVRAAHVARQAAPRWPLTPPRRGCGMSWRPRTLDGVPAIWTPAQATGTNAAGVASDAIKCHEAVPLGYALVRPPPVEGQTRARRLMCCQTRAGVWCAPASRTGKSLFTTMRRGPSTAWPGAPAAQPAGGRTAVSDDSYHRFSSVYVPPAPGPATLLRWRCRSSRSSRPKAPTDPCASPATDCMPLPSGERSLTARFFLTLSDARPLLAGPPRSTTCPPLTLPASPPEAPFVVPFSFSVKQAEVSCRCPAQRR